MTLRNALGTLFGIGSLLALAGSCAAAPLAATRGLRDRAGAYELTVLIDGAPAPTYQHGGETYVLGQLGARYTLRVSNHSGQRIEAVVSVDGRDAIDGRPADFRTKRGYLVPAWGSVDIEGWRISHAEAAAFRFSSVPDSYAARTGSGRDVGVVGVAIFPERYVPRPVYRPRPHRIVPPYLYDDAPAGAAPAPRDSASEGGRGEAAPKSRMAEAAPEASRSRPGLGTEYGEAVSSPIHEVEFVRANFSRPSVVLGARYNDRTGLLALGIPVDGNYATCYSEGDLRRTADPFPVVDRRFAAPPSGWRGACNWR